MAAALAAGADYLVTFNLKDFSPAALQGLPVQVVGPSRFLKECLARDPTLVFQRLVEQASAIGISTDVLLGNVAKAVPSFVDAVRLH